MKIKTYLPIALAFFLISCVSQIPSTPTKIATPTAPYKEIEYKLIGIEEEGRFVVVDPKYASDREALQFVINDLCKYSDYCAIHFWDDEKYAVRSVFEMYVENKNARVAFYGKDKTLGETLEIFATPKLSEDDYVSLVKQKGNLYVNALSKVYDLILKASDDTSLLQDNGWKKELYIALEDLDNRANEFANIGEPPPQHEVLHSKIIDLRDETQLFLNAYKTGVEDLNPEYINQANTHNDNMTRIMNEISELIKKIPSSP